MPGGGQPGSEQNNPEPVLKRASKPARTSQSSSAAESLNDSRGISRVAFEALGIGAAPVTLLGALAFYFGWVRTNSLYSYFGIDTSVLGFSTQDYLMRSADALFVPFGTVLLALLISLRVHWLIRRWVDQGRFHQLLHWGVRVGLATGAVLFTFGLVSVFRPLPFRVHFLFPSLSLGIGIVILAYASYLHGWNEDSEDKPSSSHGGSQDKPSSSHQRFVVSVTLVSMLVVLCLYWAASDYARALGRGRAHQLARQLATEPTGAVLYSKEQLHIQAPGVQEIQLDNGGSGYRFRYEGLRLLIRSSGKYFLVPALWSPTVGVAILVPDNESVRLEFTREVR